MNPKPGWLSSFSTFSTLTEADRALIERIVVVDAARPGHVFVREGDHASAVTAALYFLIEGEVSVAASAPAGGFGVRRRLGPGQTFGSIALVADVARTATCTAETTVTYAKLDRLVFNDLFRKNVGVHARFQLAIARGLASDLRALREALVHAIDSGDDARVRERFGG